MFEALMRMARQLQTWASWEGSCVESSDQGEHGQCVRPWAGTHWLYSFIRASTGDWVIFSVPRLSRQ